jgi:hypothetical protein
MSINKYENVENNNEKRQKPGPKLGSGEMRQICVSVKRDNWNTALFLWRRGWRKRPKSWLVNDLVERYVETKGDILETEAV